MKKICLVIAFAIFSLSNVSAQDTQFGATAGYLSLSNKVNLGDGSISVSESGFYGGIFAEFGISDELKIQPELLYASVDEISFLLLPVMAKYYVADKFNLQGGLQFNFLLEDTDDDFSAFGVGLGLGAGYDITEKFLVQARYAFQINNSYTGEGDFESRFNFLNIGLGYRF